MAETRALTLGSIRSLLTDDKIKAQIRMALPDAGLTSDRLIRVALTQIRKNPSLLSCTQESLLGAIVQSAQLGLEPDGVTGFAYLVPYGRECTLIPGYKGLMNLARRSGEIGAIEARAVFQKDLFEFEFGLKPRLYHKPNMSGDSGDAIYYYAIAHFKDGSMPQFEVMTVEQINKIRDRSRSAKAGFSPWKSDYDAMAKKTVIRRLLKYAPTSVQVQRAIALDERADNNLPQDLGDVLNIEQENPEQVQPSELFGKEDNPNGGK